MVKEDEREAGLFGFGGDLSMEGRLLLMNSLLGFLVGFIGDLSPLIMGPFLSSGEVRGEQDAFDDLDEELPSSASGLVGTVLLGSLLVVCSIESFLVNLE